jgi:hypothetical protein
MARVSVACLIVLTTVCRVAVGAPVEVRMELRVAQESVDASMVPMHLQSSGQVFYLEKSAQTLIADDIVAAEATSDPFGPKVSVSFTEAGGKKINDLTTRLLGKQLAVIVGGNLVFVGTVQEPLSDQISLSGLGTLDYAKAVAAQISGGLNRPSIAPNRTVYVATTTSEPRPDAKEVVYLVTQTKSDDRQLSSVRSALRQVLEKNGFRTVVPSQSGVGDLNRQYCLELTLKDSQYERMTIRVTVFRLLSPQSSAPSGELPKLSLQWTGTFGIDSQFFKGNQLYVLERIVKRFESGDVALQEKW